MLLICESQCWNMWQWVFSHSGFEYTKYLQPVLIHTSHFSLSSPSIPRFFCSLSSDTSFPLSSSFPSLLFFCPFSPQSQFSPLPACDQYHSTCRGALLTSPTHFFSHPSVCSFLFDEILHLAHACSNMALILHVNIDYLMTQERCMWVKGAGISAVFWLDNFLCVTSAAINRQTRDARLWCLPLAAAHTGTRPDTPRLVSHVKVSQVESGRCVIPRLFLK